MHGLGSKLARQARGVRLRGESLEERQCLSVTVTSIVADGGTRLKITGDNQANFINVVDRGDGHIEVTNDQGALLGSADNVNKITAELKGGKDEFNYSLSNPLAHRTAIFLDLGAGADSATFDWSAGVSGANLKIEVDGGDGADSISAIAGSVAAGRVDFAVNGGAGKDLIGVVASGITIDAEGVFRTELLGGEGADTIESSIDAQIAGKLNVRSVGNKGVDLANSVLTANAGSTGTLLARANGAKGVDNVTLNVFDNSGEEGSLLASLKASIVDRLAEDTLAYTDLVELITGPAPV